MGTRKKSTVLFFVAHITTHTHTHTRKHLRGMVTLKCCGSDINNFLLSSFKPTPVGPVEANRERCSYKLCSEDEWRS